ncbi:MAG: lipopolysaccharide assembly protein LapA domain-containing protein [Planktomarina sp.]
MRYLKMLVLLVIAVGLILVALGNTTSVPVKLMPESIGGLVGFNPQLELPMFFILFGGVGIGLLVGFIWEYLREHKHRKAVRTEHKKVVRLEREVDRMKSKQNEGKDDVLALIES